MADALLEVDRLAKRFGGIVATDDVDIAVPEGELHAVIGPNGAGKTTLISQLSGTLLADAGRIHFGGADITRVPAWRRSHLGLARAGRGAARGRGRAGRGGGARAGQA